MLNPARAPGRLIDAVPVALSLMLTFGGLPALAAETCAWTKTPSGADLGTCAEPSGRSYCVTCQYAPRVCVRTPC